MKRIAISLNQYAALEPAKIAYYEKQLQPEIERLRAARNMGYDSVYASINLPDDKRLLDEITALVREKLAYAPKILVLIGIGGSSLGTRALHDALHGLYYNEQQPSIRFYCVETVDTDAVRDVMFLVEAVLARGEHVLINVISKSGTTIETVANYELFVSLIKKYYPETWHQFVIATTDYDSKLWQFAMQHSLSCVAIPSCVGGRYAVFSAVGLVPLALLGVDIYALHDGARTMVDACLDLDFKKNPAALTAAAMVEQYRRGIKIHDMFLFSVEYESIGRWYRQLVGESLGKTSHSGECVGITPLVSLGSTDLHSVGQLYLGGPHNIYTTFVAVEKNKATVIIPEYPESTPLSALVQGMPLSSVMDAIMGGVTRAYDADKLPYCMCSVPSKTPYYSAQLLQWKMVEILYVGYLLGVNPFDQPHVERYKIETRKILAHE